MTSQCADRPLISFITCVYNQQSDIFLQTARSVSRHLDYSEWIIVDDGSTSEYRDILVAVLKSTGLSQNVKLCTLVNNSGLSVARNKGIAMASGEWLVILDSDDLIPADLGTILSSLSSKTTLVSGCAIYFQSEQLFERRSVAHFAKLFKDHCQSPLNPFFWYDFYYHGIIARRDVFGRLGGYDERYRIGEDQEILIRFVLAEGEEHVYFTNDLVYYYRENPLGVCANQLDLVHNGYCETMTHLIKQIDAGFCNCRFGKTTIRESARVDEYEYFHTHFGWLNFNQAVSAFHGI
jgi:glycosyltransferase involved in cell wall biosynthesis